MGEHTAVEWYDGDVVLITLSSKPSPHDIQQHFLAPLDARLKQRQRFSVIVDSSRVSTINPTITKTIIEWLRNNRPHLKEYLRGSSIVVSSTFVRTLLNIVFTAQKPVAPMEIVSNVSEAWAFMYLIDE